MPEPAVTNLAARDSGMTLAELIQFVTDCLQTPAMVDRDAPLRVRSTIRGRILEISAPVERSGQ